MATPNESAAIDETIASLNIRKSREYADDPAATRSPRISDFGSSSFASRASPRASKLVRVVFLHLLDSLVRSEKGVFGHVGGILARRRMLAHRFGQRAN